MQGNGEAIKALRERSGFSQLQFADAAGVELSAYNRIESGKRKATNEQIVAIARALKVPIPAIINDTEEAA